METKDFWRDGTQFKYCVRCDHHYLAGTFDKHVQTFAHIASETHRRAMKKWYATNS